MVFTFKSWYLWRKDEIYYLYSFSRLGSEARDCNGPRKQYRICENPPCPAGLPGFRDWQCQAYSVRASYPKHALQWQAVLDEGMIPSWMQILR